MTSSQPDPSEIAEGMALFMEALAPVREAAVGFHNQLLADGFPPAAAEVAAQQFLVLALNKALQ